MFDQILGTTHEIFFFNVVLMDKFLQRKTNVQLDGSLV